MTKGTDTIKRCKCGGGIEMETRKVTCYYRVIMVCPKCHRGIAFESHNMKEAMLGATDIWNEIMGGDD